MGYARFKHIFFDEYIEAKRFTQMYGGLITNSEYWTRTYFGEEARNKYQVIIRTNNEKLNNIVNDLKLKKCKWNGKTCYYFTKES